MRTPATSAETLLTISTAVLAGIPIQINGFASIGTSGKNRSASRAIDP